MQNLIESGRIVDFVLIFVALECAGIVAVYRLTGRGLRPVDLATLVLPGVFLFLALRAALTGEGWTWIAGWLLAALATHLADLANRWQGR